MPESEKKDGKVPEPLPGKVDVQQLDDKSLESVAGGMAASVPHVDAATSLNSLATPVASIQASEPIGRSSSGGCNRMRSTSCWSCNACAPVGWAVTSLGARSPRPTRNRRST